MSPSASRPVPPLHWRRRGRGHLRRQVVPLFRGPTLSIWTAALPGPVFDLRARGRTHQSWTVTNFTLPADGKPATVTTQAKFVKRRRTHIQELRPALATELRQRFKSKLPAAAALKMPSKYHLADLLRDDLADARKAWIKAAANDQEREERQRSDFRSAVNHEGEVAVFYSTRHGHGTALADAGVPQKDIAQSMHHASQTTTQRYLHSDRGALSKAIAQLPDLSYRVPLAETGTMGKSDNRAVCTTSCAHPCATGSSPMESGGVSGDLAGETSAAGSIENSRTSAIIGEELNDGLLAELADAMDSKSISQKEYRFKSDRGHWKCPR